MSVKQQTSNELRCFCARTPLLATYGVDEKGKPYIHIKVFKQQRIFGEVVVIGGTSKVQLHCRECLRWHTVVMTTPTKVELVEDTLDVPLAEEMRGAQ